MDKILDIDKDNCITINIKIKGVVYGKLYRIKKC